MIRDVEVDAVTHDSRRVRTRRAASLASPARRTDGHDHAPDAVAAGAVALLVERLARRSACRRRRGSPCVRPRSGRSPRALHGDPSHGDARASASPAPTARPRRPTCSRRSRAAAGDRVGRDRHRRRAHRRRSRSRREHTTPEATELQALLARMRDAGVGDGRDGGVVARARPAPRRRHALRRGVLHEPLARPPRLPRHARRVLRGQGAAVHAARSRAAAAVNVDDAHGDELARARDATPGLDGRDATRSTTPTPTCARPTSSSARRRHALRTRRPPYGARRRRAPRRSSGASTSRTRSRRPPRPRAAGFALDAVVAGLERRRSSCPGRLERVDAGQPFAVLVDYAHTPDALDPRPGARPAPLAGAGARRDRACSAAAATATAAKRPLMGAAVARRRRRRRAHVRQPALRGPRRRSPTTVLAGPRRRARGVAVELDRRAAIRDALAAAAARRRRRHRRQGPRDRPDRRRAHRAVRRPRRRARGARGDSDGADRGARSRRSPAARVVAGDPEALATSFTIDSRCARARRVLRRARAERDGHDFVADAFARGAARRRWSTA